MQSSLIVLSRTAIQLHCKVTNQQNAANDNARKIDMRIATAARAAHTHKIIHAHCVLIRIQTSIHAATVLCIHVHSATHGVVYRCVARAARTIALFASFRCVSQPTAGVCHVARSFTYDEHAARGYAASLR